MRLDAPENWIDELPEEPAGQDADFSEDDEPVSLATRYQLSIQEAQQRVRSEQIELMRLRHCLRFFPSPDGHVASAGK